MALDNTRRRTDEEEDQQREDLVAEAEIQGTEPEPEKASGRSGFLATLRKAYQQAKHGRTRGRGTDSSRSQRGADRTKSFLLLAGAVVVMFFVFLGVFSTSSAEKRERERRMQPRLGRPETSATVQGQGSVTPLLDADVNQGDPNAGLLRPEDVLATSRRRSAEGERDREQPAPQTASAPTQEFALGNVPPFGTRPPEAQPPVQHPVPAPQQEAPVVDRSEGLKESSLVFVRTAASGAQKLDTGTALPEPALSSRFPRPLLPTGTRLVARLQTPVSTAVDSPVIAAIEYNYERNGENVVPAGTKAYGKLEQASGQGYVGIRFHALAMADGDRQKIDAGAMGLDFGPLKGKVTGRNRGKRMLVRSLTGIGTMAAYLVGGRGYSLSDPLNQSALLRERIASNIGMAGEQELTRLAFSQNIVVTVPGQTRFFIVLQKDASESKEPGPAVARGTASPNLADRDAPPTSRELRELIALKRELEQMYSEVAASRSVTPQPQKP